MTNEHVVPSIDRHFARGLGARAEADMRAHLPGCASCRTRYERHLLYGRLVRDARPAKERLARGLGLRLAPARRTWPRWTVAALATAAAAALLLVIGGRGVDPSGQGIGVRGGATSTGPALFVYRLRPGAAPALAADRLSRGDELAFAYANPGGKKYLWIFGVDEHRHVYWYYPAWPAGTPAPGPFVAEAGPGPHELPEAVRHAFDGGRIELHALVSDEPLTVSDIEARLSAAGIAFPGADGVQRAFEVAP